MRGCLRRTGIPELVKSLQERGRAVFLVSGGFRPIINPIAESLGIPLDHVFANTILHSEDGSYTGFDAQEFTSRSGGKASAIQAIKVLAQNSGLMAVRTPFVGFRLQQC
jgi:phosphoserine phosphatase